MVTCARCGTDNVDGARFCNSCGSGLGTPRPVEGERRLATILFADVASSTALAEELDAEDWAAVMNGAFAFMNAAVTRYDGTVSRLMGDAVLALFGAPVAHEDDAERAVRAALEIRDGAVEYGQRIEERYGVEFRLRIGIHTGVAVLAFVGDEIKTEYTAMGDAANVAARLQSVAPPGTILISADTHRLVRGAFEIEPRGPVELKGKQAKRETFEVLSARLVPGRARGLEGLSSPMVGRKQELDLLLETLEGVRQGSGAAVAVVGEAGVGKSRLIAEIRTAAGSASIAPIRWFEGRAISYGHALAYHPWQQVGRQLVGATDGAGPAVVRERLRAFRQRLELPEGDLPYLETMLAVDTEASRSALTGLDRDTVVHGIADAVMRCLRAEIRSSDRPEPHFLVFDDLHWADAASLELLSHVATMAATDPLLLVCVLRPDRKAPSWMTLDRLEGSLGPSFLRVALSPLDPECSRELLGNLLHVEGLPEETRTVILTRSEGNPFFLEEVLRSLMDSGHIVHENGHWRATRDIVEVDVPETLAGVLGARIDRLPDSTKRVAQTASVLGRIFHYRALHSVCRDAPPAERIENVDPHLGTLTYEELVRERTRDPEREFIFKHALTCEAAYSLLLRRRRRELHLRAGRALEELYPDRVEELAPVLAHHFSEGGEPAAAARYGMRAGARALKLYALTEAVVHYERAVVGLERAPDPDRELLVDTILGWTFARSKATRYEGVLERLERAEEMTRDMEDRARLARVLSWTANVHVLTGFPSRAVLPLLESQELAQELGEEELMLLPYFFATEALVDRDPRKAVAQLDQLIALARKHDSPDIEGHAVAVKATAHARLGEFDEAEATIARALEMAPRIGAPVKEADIHITVGLTYFEMGKVEEGLEHARRGAKLAQSAGAIECACAGTFGVGMGELERNQLDDALAAFEKSLELADYSGWEGWVNRIRAGVAAARFEGGSAEAVADLRSTLENARSEQDDYLVAVISERLARAHLHLDQPEEAEGYMETAMAYYRRAGMRPYMARALETSARIHERRNRPEQAQGLRNEALALQAAFRAAS